MGDQPTLEGLGVSTGRRVTQAPPVAVAADLERAVQYHQAGQFEQAAAIYNRLPDHPDALHLLGVIALQSGDGALAVERIGKAITRNSSTPTYYNNRGLAYAALQRIDDAVTDYRQAIVLNPGYVEAHLNLGNALRARKQFDAALDSYRQATMLNPSYAEAHNNAGITLAGLGRWEEATADFLQALACMPSDASIHNNLGNVLKEQGRLDDAIANYQQALTLAPDYVEAHCNLGIVHYLRREFEQAAACFQKALDRDPRYADAYFNLGVLLYDLGRRDDAMLCYRNVIAVQPAHAKAHFNLGCLLRDQGAQDEAIASYRQALACQPDYAEAYHNLAGLLEDCGAIEQAMHCYQQALRFDPSVAQSHNNIGILLQRQGQLDGAIRSYHAALTLDPGYAEAHNNLGVAYKGQGRLEQAVDCYRKALALKPDYVEAYSNMLLTLVYTDRLDPQELTDVAKAFGSHIADRLLRRRPFGNDRDPDRKLKIGYVSGDFLTHAVSYSAEPLLARHDHAQFELYGYANHAQEDAVTRRLKGYLDHWRVIHRLSDDEVADLIEADGIDILVDLSGHTAHNRLLVFARKPAPLQIAYLGYPATTGMAAMDYRISDPYAEPEGMTEGYNVERLWRLPEIFCCYRPREDSPAVIDHMPQEDNGYVTFGSFNNFAKVTERVIGTWSKILAGVPSAKLMLEIHGLDDARFKAEVEQRFGGYGVEPERLILIARKPGNHYVLYNRIDVALDPFPCNGGTTSLDSLWMGVPFVTLAGTAFYSRLGVTLLTNAGMGELIAVDEEEYVGKAVMLANDKAKLQELRAGLRERVKRSPIMDAQRFAGQMEQAYRGMWRGWCETG